MFLPITFCSTLRDSEYGLIGYRLNKLRGGDLKMRLER
jgi:hypothetical protein